MMDRKLIAIALVVIVTAGVGGAAIILGMPPSNQVPPPDMPPGEGPILVTSGDIVLWAEAIYWQDFMPVIDRETGPPFYTVVWVNITNNGDTTIENLGAIRTTIYFNGTLTPLVTLNLTQTTQTFVPITVGPGESIVIEYMNDRNTVFSPDIEEGTAFYSRILFVWGSGNEVILTTPPSELEFTY